MTQTTDVRERYDEIRNLMLDRYNEITSIIDVSLFNPGERSHENDSDPPKQHTFGPFHQEMIEECQSKNISPLELWILFSDWYEINSWVDWTVRYRNELLEYDTEKYIQDMYLFSPGSAASRSIRDHFGLKNISYGLSSLRQGRMAHILDPKTVFRIEEIKSLYVVSHPIETLISHYLNNIMTQGDGVLNAGGPNYEYFNFIFSFCPHVPGTKEENLKRINTFFDRYLEYGIDFFMLKENISNWSNCKNSYAVKYEHFKEQEPEIRQWLKKPSDFPEFEWRQRLSKREYLSESILSRLEKMYAEAIHEYEKVGENNVL